jgi:hypothetical protein
MLILFIVTSVTPYVRRIANAKNQLLLPRSTNSVFAGFEKVKSGAGLGTFVSPVLIIDGCS